MGDEPGSVTADDDAREFVRENGGHVYVWASRGDLEQVSLEKPDGVQFVQIAGDGFDLLQDVTIDGPSTGWHLELRHIPHRHVAALYGQRHWVWGAPGFSSPGI